MNPVEILVYEKPSAERPPLLVATLPLPLNGPTELGRQKTTDESLYSTVWQPAEQCHRIVVARGTEQTIGRVHLRIEPLADGRLQVVNVSSRSTVQVENGPALSRGVPFQCDLSTGGTLFKMGSSRLVRVQPKGSPRGSDPDLGALPSRTLPPEEFTSRLGQSLTGRLKPPTDLALDSDSLIEWLQMALTLLQSATASPDFFPRAARAVVDLADMDSGRVLLFSSGGWREEASASADPRRESDWQPSQRILDRVRAERKTFWELPKMATMGSVLGVQAVVAAPILDQKGDVIGVLYGDRRQLGRPITRVEAMLVELLACGVASRLARLKEEQATLRFEQFFTPQLARHLASNPEMLDGRSANVTILFCDVRGFSRHSRRLPPAALVKWIGDVMAVLSDCVIEHQGVVVDYVGDEVMAMWGAPDDQPDHALLACKAALAMLDQLTGLNSRWQQTLGEPMSLGIGLNSGPAHVGNTGSPRKFKYGPLGNTVNLASRIQGVTKYLRCRLLLTEQTCQEVGRLDPQLRARARRVGKVSVVNIDEPVMLHELPRPDYPGSLDEWKENYEKALDHYESESYRLAARVLQPLITEAINDGPSIVLLSRAVQGLANGTPPHHPVWEVPK
jgi:adenylate cyclase